MKLWKNNSPISPEVEKFTVGKDRELDLLLAKFDVFGSIAHAKMLQEIKLLTLEEYVALDTELKSIYQSIQKGQFQIDDKVEDVHSQIEFMLTEKLGDIGRKIHTGRSRNDQVLLDIRMFLREEIKELVTGIEILFDLFLELSEKYKTYFLPGYTHMQIAMPSSFGLWFAAYAESLVDDLIILHSAYRVINKSPFGSAAGYGSSLPLKRQLTSDLLGFDSLNQNVVYAQMGRGKSEKAVSSALSFIASTLNKFASDVCLYTSQNFGFISFPDELTTGSSIMPHKKNPDVFELIRAKCNRLIALPNEINLITTNLPSGYHRDMQILKENLFPVFNEMKECLRMTRFMLNRIEIVQISKDDKIYQNLYSVEAVNRLVQKGIPFRAAYQKIAEDIQQGKFKPPTDINYTHEGSIGNLQNDKIKEEMTKAIGAYNFKKVDASLLHLLKREYVIL